MGVLCCMSLTRKHRERLKQFNSALMGHRMHLPHCPHSSNRTGCEYVSELFQVHHKIYGIPESILRKSLEDSNVWLREWQSGRSKTRIANSRRSKGGRTRARRIREDPYRKTLAKGLTNQNERRGIKQKEQAEDFGLAVRTVRNMYAEFRALREELNEGVL